MKRNIKLEYYVLNFDFNNRKIIKYNVLGNWEDTIRKKKKKSNSYEEIKELLMREFKYRYWGKAEYEIIAAGLMFQDESAVKIDVWSQIEPNFNIIADYIKNTMNLEWK